MRHLVRFLGQRLAARGVRIERQIELIDPAQLEARTTQGIIAQLRYRMALGEIGGMRGDLVSDDAFLNVVAVRQPEMLDRLHSHYPSARTKRLH
jgi:hypothetical protein